MTTFFFPFPGELVTGTILARYKRFLADIRLADGSIVVAHVANSGSMATCWQEGARVSLTRLEDDGRRKLSYSLQAVEMPDGWVSVNTMNPNRAVAGAILQGVLPELRGYEFLQSEVKFASGSRFDLCLFNREQLGAAELTGLRQSRAVPVGKDFIQPSAAQAAVVEIKNATLRSGQGVIFPDAVTERGQKHLRHLMELRAQGLRAVILFFAGRSGCDWVGPAAGIDPDYAELLCQAVEKGVEAMAVKVEVARAGMLISGTLPVRLVY